MMYDNEKLNEFRSRSLLALTRRVGETIRINGDISIQVLSVSGQQVKLGIRTPTGTTIHREEIYKLIKAEREKAVSP